MADFIVVTGARQHNLKNITVAIPRHRLVVITGPSGSGKSSLAFDTIYAEGQRRYVESLSAYARQFLEQMEKPDVDSIDGLSPAIAIEQKTARRSPRSTVGTVTEIYDYLRLLFARAGTPHCPRCGERIATQTVQQIVDRAMALPASTRIHVLAPIVRGRKGEYRKELEALRKAGFVRVRVDGRLFDLAEDIELARGQAHTIEVLVDRLVIRPGIEARLADSLGVAFRYGGDLATVAELAERGDEPVHETVYSQRFACIACGISVAEITPRLFSFNSPYGACPACTGLGTTTSFDPDLKETDSEWGREGRERFISMCPCPACGGARLKPEALAVRIGGRPIAEVAALSVGAALEFLAAVQLSEPEASIAEGPLREARERLRFLQSVGLDYLTLDRPAATLSGGEAQRIALATQIGAGLSGVLYVLDEPSIGLHQRDNARLLDTLRRLQALGNTVIVVEHDPDTILAADWVLDMGPGAGEHGGNVVAAGTPAEILANPNSLTGRYLSGTLAIPVPARRRSGNGGRITLRGARHHNLRGVDADFPLGTMICVTGVSGSGKSSLAIDTLYRALAQRLHGSKENPGAHDALDGWQLVDKVIDIDQAPIGHTPSSNPATYTGLMTPLRELFAQLPEARLRGYGPGRFSFNVKGGRCEACAGDGVLRIEMHFLPDVYVACEVCRGARYNRETLEVRFKGKNIAEVLDLSVAQALDFLGAVPSIRQRLETLTGVGLDYLRLGQAATTLSGGEAQRVKLARELARRATGRTLYILDEPTTGLHFHDVNRLLDVLNRLVDAGNTAVVIEHNLDVIKSADWVMDLGPEGGAAGGAVVAAGPPEEVARAPGSHTGEYLRAVLPGDEVGG